MHAIRLIITLGLDEPVLRRNVADVDDRSEPAKVPGRDFRRGRRVEVHAEVRSLGKNVCSSRIPPEYLILCTRMWRADRVVNNTWLSGENWRFCSAGSAGIVARVIVVSMEVGD